MEVAECGTETVMKSSMSKKIREASSTSSIIKGSSSLLKERSLEQEHISSQSTLVDDAIEQPSPDDDKLAAELDKKMTALMPSSAEANCEQLVSATSSSSSSSAMSLVKKSSTEIVSSSVSTVSLKQQTSSTFSSLTSSKLIEGAKMSVEIVEDNEF